MDNIISRLRNHYIPLLSLACIAEIVFSFILTPRDTITFAAQSTGYISITLLAFSFVIGPVTLLMKKKNPLSTYFRRDIGIVGGVLAVVHSATGLFVHLRGKPWLYFLVKTHDGYAVRLDSFGLGNYTGLFSALIIIILILTSNDLMFRKLNPSGWKNVQRSSYLMFILAIIHCFFYRHVKAHPGLIYSFYIPLLSVVFLFQITGVWLTLTRKQKKL